MSDPRARPYVRFRWSLASIMIAVAALALVFAVFGVELGAGVAVVYLVILSPLAFVPSGRRLEVSAWIMASYPMVVLAALYATWIVGWAALGHPPRPSLDDPKQIGETVDLAYDVTGVVMSGAPLSLLACIVLAITLGLKSIQTKEKSKFRIYPLSVFVVLFWFASFFVLLFEPFNVLGWHFD
jgi:hypothetical protein